MPRKESDGSASGRNSRKVLQRSLRSRGWKTSDREEIERRRLRASQEPIAVEAQEPEQPFYGTYRTSSRAANHFYVVEIRSLTEIANSCECPDFRVNGLGTCKHVEAVLAKLRRRGIHRFRKAAREGCPGTEIYLASNGNGTKQVQVSWSARTSSSARELLSSFFSAGSVLMADPVDALPAMERALAAASSGPRGEIRIARDVRRWVEELRRRRTRTRAREDFLRDVRAGRRSLDFLKLPLYPYQHEGMLHLAFGERALLADDMGLGKTIQAIAACELLRRLRGIERVLVVSPVSLKAEWEEQIAKFTGVASRQIWGPRGDRLKHYRESSFFYLANYEQIRNDAEDVNRILAPDVVILDEAQRIKNWQTKTAKAVKRLSSSYAFVLTGTPLENRIDEIYSIVDFLDPHVLGPLFRFNREFYDLDERGRPQGYRNLDELRRRIRPLMLRRRKEEVEEQLPARTVNNYFVKMKPEQRDRYEEYSSLVARLLGIARRRSLKPEEHEKLQKWLACMRMICDTPFILDEECRISPKLEELETILEEVLESPETKVLIFSEWERMLLLVRELAEQMRLGFAWHTGSVPPKERREEIRRFKEDPFCRLFLSTESGGVGLNLQAAGVVVNLDLPWNPARLEQRIARAWRKHQSRPVSVINLVCQDSLEHRILSLLGQKQLLADGVLDGRGDLKSMPLPSGRRALVDRLEELMGMDWRKLSESAGQEQAEVASNGDPYELFRQDVAARLPDRLILLEAHAAGTGKEKLLMVVEGEAEQFRPAAERLLRESFGNDPGRPVLEMIDRGAYEAIQRLIDQGFLRRNGDSARRIHCHPALENGNGRADEERRARARKIFAEADRGMRMADLLAEGGFPPEAVAPAYRGVQEALRALAALEGVEIGEPDQEVSLNLVHAGLVSRGALPDAAVSTLARIRLALKGNPPPPEALALNLVQSVREIFEHVLLALDKADLG